MLTASALLDSVQQSVIDNSDSMRLKMLSWLNDGMRELLNQPRLWWFLRNKATLAMVSGSITLPADFGEFVELEIGEYRLKKESELTPADAFDLSFSDSGIPYGYTIYNGALQVVPTPTDGQVTLNYTVKTFTDVTDSTAATIFPVECENFLKRYVLTRYFEYDADERFPTSAAIQAKEMSLLKALDNKDKPIPYRNPRGYTRERR